MAGHRDRDGSDFRHAGPEARRAKRPKGVVSRTALALGLLLSGASAAVAQPARGEPLWGVNGHPLTSYPGISIEQQLDLLVGLGAQSYRVDVTALSQIDRLRELIAAAKARHLTILPVLLPPVDVKTQGEDSLYTQSRQFAKIMADEFKADIPVWELGNESENYTLIKPCEMRDDGTQYPCAWGLAGGLGALDYYGPRLRSVAAMLRGLSDGIHVASPTARRAIGSAGWGHVGFFERLQDSGVDWDISVWHMYGADPDYAFKHLAALGKPIWVTEFDAPVGDRGAEGETRQAAGLAGMIADLRRLAPTYGVEGAFIYELCDEAYWAPSGEAFMGLVHLRKAPGGGWALGDDKPAFEAVKQAIAAPPR